MRGASERVQWAADQLLEKMPDLTEPKRWRLVARLPHGFRQTFGTQSEPPTCPSASCGSCLAVAADAPVNATTEERCRREEIAQP